MDTGLNALVTIAQFYKFPADAGQIKHEFGRPGEAFSFEQIIRAASSLTLKAKKLNVSLTDIRNEVLPVIAQANDGSFFIVAAIQESESKTPSLDGEHQKNKSVLIHDLTQSTPKLIDEDTFSSISSGAFIFLTRRVSLSSKIQDKFDISWFIPSLIKYRRLFTEVVIASFFLQIFALATPLFFQVVMDKVLVHRGLTTLDVLAIGFFVLVVFEAFLGGFRDYLFSHTTNRVDVELGSRLYHHLLSLPVSYFEARQVGQNVARVRELDTIRNFITGTALTLVIDLFFVFVFIAVMWYYSPTLTFVVLATIPCYVMLSVFITPILRHRLNEKFKHGAENTAFLTESLTGINTVKSLSVEPQMKQKLEGHLSSYVHASFKSQN